jgi:hypothetical protein
MTSVVLPTPGPASDDEHIRGERHPDGIDNAGKRCPLFTKHCRKPTVILRMSEQLRREGY